MTRKQTLMNRIQPILLKNIQREYTYLYSPRRRDIEEVCKSFVDSKELKAYKIISFTDDEIVLRYQLCETGQWVRLVIKIEDL